MASRFRCAENLVQFLIISFICIRVGAALFFTGARVPVRVRVRVRGASDPQLQRVDSVDVHLGPRDIVSRVHMPDNR